LPALPVDLERVIFEMAAHIYPLSMPQLVLVAWRVKIWIPLLYRTIVLIPRRKPRPALNGHPILPVDTFIDMITRKSTSFMRDTVRHVLIPRMPVEDAFAILSACTIIDNLSLGNTIVKLHSISFIQHLTLKRLYCNLNTLFRGRQIDFTHRLFSRITHLGLYDYPAVPDPAIWRHVALVPHLTHLSFNHGHFAEISLMLL
ncbi:hypothetical protein B0H19DRAFT_885498, partial [Mycena capillaripes]